MTPSLRIGRYVRISKREQRNGLDRQLFELEKCVLALGGSLDNSPLWVDIQSGRDFDRVEFQKMLAAINAHDVDVIMTYRVDRLARDLEVNAMLARTFEQQKIRLYDLQKSGYVDFNNPEDWSNYAHSGVAAEAESRRLSRRIKAGYEFNRTMGRASSKPPWGYVRNKESGKYELDPDLEKAVRDTLKVLLENGNFQKTCRVVARRWKKQWEYSSFRKWVSNPVLRGHTGYRQMGRKWGEIRYDTHPEHAVLTEQELKTLEALVAERRSHWGQNMKYTPQPLSSIVYCGRCGTKMVITRGTYCPKHGDKPYYFSCRERSQRVKPEPCNLGRSCPVGTIEAAVIAELVKAHELLAIIAQTPVALKESPELLEARRKLDQLNRMGDDPEYEPSKARFIAKIAALQAEQGNQSSETPENRELLQAIFANPLTFSTLPPDEKRQIFNGLVSKVVVNCTEEDTGEVSRRGKPKMLVSWSFEVYLKPLGI